jgi:Na+/H+-dicarboxylate symporter
MPEFIKVFLLTTSLLIKQILLFLLPGIIFFLVFSSFAQLSSGFMMFAFLLISTVCLSNFTSLMLAYPVGSVFQNFIAVKKAVSVQTQALEPAFLLGLKPICSNSLALVIGVVMGVFASSTNNQRLKHIAAKGSVAVNWFLSKLFTPLLPLFILGFMLKAQHDGLLVVLFKNFVPLLMVILGLFVTYMGLLYMVVHKFKWASTVRSLRHIFPAGVIGFSSMSSAAAMPVLIGGASKNAKDKELPKRIVPFITNTHMMGDALSIPLMAMSLYIVEYGHFPPLNQYMYFAGGYVLAKFASAGIPGGTILIMTPVLEAKLGFTAEMSSLILTMYLLFDPVCSFGNIFGNGLFSMGFERLKDRVMEAEVSA